ncbi:50S ribosomal protein L23 [Candidatus Uhrbacteria bacterium]|nr:50S ribosomal protein L23 [Candidatus Uhrbacteria bacterium]
MAFLDKLLRFKKKPFKGTASEVAAPKATKAAKEKAEVAQGSGKYAYVLVRPHISERAQDLQPLNQYVFEVKVNSTKHEVARAIADLYGIKPVAVQMMKVRGKALQFGRTRGETKAWKKAIVTLPAGKIIDVYKR